MAVLASTPAASAGKVVPPQWDQRPTAEHILAFYPLAAARAGKTGKVVLNCEVSEVGALSGCKTISETPEGYGFGNAAIQLTGLMKLKPATMDGVAVKTTTQVPIGFNQPPEMAQESTDPALACYGAVASVAEADPTDTAAGDLAFFVMYRMVLALAAAERPLPTWSPALMEARLGATGRYPDIAAAKAQCENGASEFLPVD